MPKRNPPRPVDPDAVVQRIADLEALLVTPGWAWLCVEANKRYGQRAFAEHIEHLVRTQTSPEVIAAQTVSLASARMAVGAIVNLPTETLEALKRKLATQAGGDTPVPSLGPNVEVSRGDRDAH